MSEENFNKNPNTGYESLCDLNLLGIWFQCGSDWSSAIKEEIQAAIDQPIEEEKPNPTNNIILFGVLVTLALLSTAVWIQAPKIDRVVQEAGRSSVEQLILTAY